jgi:hypothetical protein
MIGLAAAPLLAPGSGSYTGRPPKPPEHLDAARYELGKNLCLGRLIPTSGSADRAAQESRLKELQGKLPRRAQPTLNLPALAGKLSAEQLAGLEYYLFIRYKVK